MLSINVGRADCGFHPFIHTLLEFNLTQHIDWFERSGGFSNSLPQTGHTFSDGLTITVSLHLGHLTGWTLTRLISSGSRLVTGLPRVRKFTLWWCETGK